jgi:Ca2+/Na+ antiporter
MAHLCNRTALLASADRCEFARLVCDDTGAGSFGSYVVHWQCSFGGSYAVVLLFLILQIMFVNALCSTAGTYLEPQLEYISKLLRLRPDVAGVTLLAFGNSAPDCFTGLAVALSHPGELDYSLMLSYTAGATLFIMTVVVGLIVWIAANRAPGWRLSRLPFYRDTLCVIVAMSVLLGISANDKVYVGEALLFICMYAFYVALVVVLRCVPPRVLEAATPVLRGCRPVCWRLQTLCTQVLRAALLARRLLRSLPEHQGRAHPRTHRPVRRARKGRRRTGRAPPRSHAGQLVLCRRRPLRPAGRGRRRRGGRCSGGGRGGRGGRGGQRRPGVRHGLHGGAWRGGREGQRPPCRGETPRAAPPCTPLALPLHSPCTPLALPLHSPCTPLALPLHSPCTTRTCPLHAPYTPSPGPRPPLTRPLHAPYTPPYTPFTGELRAAPLSN